ncbi:hypothetical protein C8E00_103417 [Chromohalobacter marismortui]|uniref:Lipopolysaccharide kinase (Kdo/WaaP) family protein n=1 Tax=Chromohalobacter marismortui TaxID=42055 RepID=A0A4R7NQ28_9GAMM|nr:MULTISPECIES: hypothetical protein [Chromohalobacter]MCI0508564.1 hypothetical protein [Chromohalobacter sp.]MCI0594348.1 hypothetical protein [Chromohalobacter sp.]TDU23044.1 hypothetical protein C8E00_103417 [Chromohalobacter marismortui]
MQFIQQSKYSTVYYDPHDDTFIKTFQPKLIDHLRYSLGIRPHPGHNFAKIAAKLQTLGIATPSIVIAKKRYLVTSNVRGVALKTRILDSPDLQARYLDILATYYHHDIHCRGLHTDNFLVRDNVIYAIDLDAYKAPTFFKYSKREFLECLQRSLKGDEAFLFDRLLKRLALDEDYQPLSKH